MVQSQVWQAKWRQVMDTFPWYRKLTDERGRSAAPLHWDDVPLLTTERLTYATSAEDAYVYFTSGTSGGERKPIGYSHADEEYYLQAKVSCFARILSITDGANSYQRAAADLGTGHAANTAVEVFHRLGIASISIPFVAPVTEHVAQLQAYRPEVLYTMPSILDHLVATAGDVRTWGVRKIILVGELCTPEWRAAMATCFALAPTDITDTYGSIELGTIAYYDHRLNRYIVLEELLAEPWSTAAARTFVTAADECVLVLTCWRRERFPALRYVTYDVVRDLRPLTVDGQERMTFAALVGRVGTEFKHGEKISLYDLEQVVQQHWPGVNMRVQQTASRTLRIVLLPAAPFPSLASAVIPSAESICDKLTRIQTALECKIPAIGTMIANGLLANMEVELAQVDDPLFAHAAGKSKKLYG